MKSLYHILAITLYALSIYFLTDCGKTAAASHPESAVTIQLRWSHQFQFAGYYAAVEKGFYAEEGLEVTFLEAVPGQDRVAPVLEGKASYGVGDAGILKLRAEGKPVVLLAQIFQHSPGILMSRRDSDIFSPYELQGKTIMIPEDPISGIAVKAMLLETLGSLDRLTILPCARGSELINDKADAVAGYLSNEPFQYQQKGLPINIIDPRSYGIDFYGDNIFTTDHEIRTHPERVKKMIRATLKGWDYALKNKEEIINLILADNPALDRENLQFEAKVIDQMIQPDLVPMGDIQPRRYARIAQLFHRLGLSPSPEVPEDFFYRQRPGFTDLLTPEERAWLNAHPHIRFAFSNDFQPALIVHEDGRRTGILKEMLDLLNLRLGTDFTIVTDDLPAIRNMIKTREVAGPLAMSPEAGKRYQLLQTRSFLTTFPVIYARPNTDGTINSVKDLYGRTCAIVGGMPEIEKLVAPHEDRMTITRTKTAIKALTRLYEGKVDYFIGLAQNNYLVHTNQFAGVQPVLAITGHNIHSVMGVRGDWPELVRILDKGLATISDGERNAINARWLKLPASIGIFPVALSAQEKDWLSKKQTVRVGITDLPPFVFLEQGQKPAGISLDFLGLISERTGIDFSYETLSVAPGDNTHGGNNWNSNFVLLQCISPHPAIGCTRLHSKPYMRTPRVVFANVNALPVNSLGDLSGHTLSLRQDSALHRLILDDYPEIKPLAFETEQDALKAVQLGKAPYYIGGLTIASQMIFRNGWTNLKVAGPSGLEDLELCFVIPGNSPELLSIIDKGLDSISEQERTAIRNRYMSMRYDHGVSSRDVIKWAVIVTGVFGGLIGMGFLWNRTLSRRVHQRTVDLDLANSLLQDEICERKQKEEELRASEESLRKAQEIVHLGSWELDLVKGTFRWTDEVFKILEVDQAHLGSSYPAYLDATHPEDRKRVDGAFTSLVEKTTSFHIKHRLQLPDGRIKYVIAQGETAYTPEDKTERAIGTLQDITEREKIEIEATLLRYDLAHLNRVMTMGELSAYLAHEINQPLGAILNNASAAQVIHSQLPQKNEILDEILEDIAKDAYRAGQIMRRIRGAVKKEDPEFELLDINDLLDEVVELLHNLFSLDGTLVQLDKHPKLPLIKGDRVRLQQVVINILTNAVEAMRNSSPMILTIRSGVKSGADVAVSISDSGPGIDEALIDDLFQPFFTTKKSGLGVGLRICLSIIQEHGGQIMAQNNPDRGASFHFTLPIDRGDSQ
jgi:two-component system sensor histidine kinase EvgS